MSGLEEDVPAPAALDSLDGTRRWTNDRDFLAGAGRDELAQPLAGVNRELRGGISSRTNDA